MSFSAPHTKLGKPPCPTDQSFPQSATCPVRRQSTCSAFRGARHSKLYTGHHLRPDSHNCLDSRTSHITNSSSKETAVLEPAARPSADLLEQQVSLASYTVGKSLSAQSCRLAEGLFPAACGGESWPDSSHVQPEHCWARDTSRTADWNHWPFMSQQQANADGANKQSLDR